MARYHSVPGLTQLATQFNTMQQSLVLDLPGEVSKLIYEYIFTVGTYIFTRQTTRTRYTEYVEYITSRLPAARPGNIPPEIALLHTCRQIYHESKLLPFALNTFYFDSLRTFIGSCNFFTTEQLSAIQKFHTMMLYFGRHALYRDPRVDVQTLLEQMRHKGRTFSSLLHSVGHVTVDFSERSYSKVTLKKRRDALLKWLTEKEGMIHEVRIGHDPSRALKIEGFLAARFGV